MRSSIPRRRVQATVAGGGPASFDRRVVGVEEFTLRL